MYYLLEINKLTKELVTKDTCKDAELAQQLFKTKPKHPNSIFRIIQKEEFDSFSVLKLEDYIETTIMFG